MEIELKKVSGTFSASDNFLPADGAEVSGLEVWVGKPVATGDRIGVIGGRGVSGQNVIGQDEEGRNISDLAFENHIHQNITVDGRSVNLARLLLSEQGWNLPVSADDGHGGVRPVTWSTEVDIGGLGGAWVNTGDSIIFFRDPAVSDDSVNDRWVAWQEGVPLGQMERVVWERIGKNSEGRDEFAWVSVNPVNGAIAAWHQSGDHFEFTNLEQYKADNGIV